MPLSSTLQTASLIRGTSVRAVEQAGHFPWVERPGEVRRIGEPFLAEHATADQAALED